MSDFKTNEYANLIGGAHSSRRRKTRCSGSAAPHATTRRATGTGFALECRAIRRLREEMGFRNVDRHDPVLPLDQ